MRVEQIGAGLHVARRMGGGLALPAASVLTLSERTKVLLSSLPRSATDSNGAFLASLEPFVPQSKTPRIRKKIAGQGSSAASQPEGRAVTNDDAVNENDKGPKEAKKRTRSRRKKAADHQITQAIDRDGLDTDADPLTSASNSIENKMEITNVLICKTRLKHDDAQ